MFAFVGSIFVGVSDVARAFQSESYAANAMWIETPSDLHLFGIGGRFNVTIWMNLTVPSFVWQTGLRFNATHFKAVRAGYTGGTTSLFFAGHVTVPVTPVIDNATGSMLICESLLDGDQAASGCGSLCWVEFQVAAPFTETTLYFESVDTFILNPDLSDISFETYGEIGKPTHSLKFEAGDRVRTTANLHVREGPGLGYALIDTMPEGTLGQIVDGPVEADGYVWWDVNYDTGIRGWSAENWLEKTPLSCGMPVLIVPLEISPQTPYYVGDTLTAKFTINNTGNAAITLDKLLLGGRFNGGTLPNLLFPDFTFQTVTLQPGQSHPYEGTLELTEAGNYQFFVAYYIENPTAEEKSLLDANNWNTSISLAGGLTDEDRTESITVELSGPEPPSCHISLQKDGAEITEIAVGESFNIYLGESTVASIEHVRFSSDDVQDGIPPAPAQWTEPFSWTVSSGGWNALTKIEQWTFTTYGTKEVWAEIEDTSGMTYTCYADIFAALPPPEWKETYWPNPWGYSFINRKTVDENIGYLPGDESITIENRKNIFIDTFDLEGIDGSTVDAYFEALNELGLFTEGGCYGMATSSLMEFVYPTYDQFLEDQEMSSIFKLEEPPVVLWQRWNGGGAEGPCPVLEHIIRYHLFQYGKPATDNFTELEPRALLDRLKEDLSNDRMCVLGIGYSVQSRHDVNKDKKVDNRDIEFPGHAVVPYSVDGNSIFVYDPNHPNEDNRAIEIYEEEGVWKWRYEFDDGIVWPAADAISTRLDLYPIEALYNSGMKPQPSEGILFLSGEATLLLTDSMGRSTGFKDGTFVEEIPGVKPIYDFSALPDEEARPWRPAYYVGGETEMTIMITGIVENGTYSLTKFGPGYFASLSDVPISEGAIDNITFTSNSATIHISQNQKPKTYNLTLNKNMEGISQTFTTVNIPSGPGATHKYTIDWNSLSLGEEGVTVQVDSDGDGVPEHTFTSGSELTQNEYMTVLCDVNGDRKVDMNDVALAARAFGETPKRPRWNPMADINQDTKIDLKDIALVAKNFGKAYS
jgi:hypothetical protein